VNDQIRNEALHATKSARLLSWDLAYAANMGIACAICHWIATKALSATVSANSDLLGEIWAAVATVFVFMTSRDNGLSAGAARLIATIVSFALCQVYLWFWSLAVAGTVTQIDIGISILMLLDRRDDIFTTGITTVVVMVVATISPKDARRESLLGPP
jgi:hypothetical protein